MANTTNARALSSMLQIISGKLFSREPERRNDLRGILYTNLWLDRKKTIETVAGRLLPTSTLLGSKALVYEVTELIEAPANGPGVLISHGMDPYLSEFAAITSFALNVICTPNAELASRLTTGQRGLAVNDPPSKFVRRTFDAQVWCQESDAEYLIRFVNDLIGLQRKSYRAAMRAIRTYVTGLHRLADDLDLAYTLLVASIESLAQGFDCHRATWEDYEETKRKMIDAALADANADTAGRVRAALLEIENVSLMRRFRDFTLAHLQPSYFREEASDQDHPAGRTELPDALQQAYRLRSRYIHNLEELPRALTLGASLAETARIDRTTVLTFQGLTRLARHVIAEFVNRQPKVAAEPYDYSLERPGIVRLPLAPQYWVGRPEGLTSGGPHLEGFLDQITEHLQRSPGAVVTDLREVLAKAEEILPTAKAQQRRRLIALYILFNMFAPADYRMANFEMIRKRYGAELEAPSVESAVVHLLLDAVPPWTLSDHEAVHRNYFRGRDKKNGLKVSRILEAGLSLVLAERHRVAGDAKRARELIAFAVENYPGRAALRDLEEKFDAAKPIEWHQVLLPARSIEAATTASTES